MSAGKYSDLENIDYYVFLMQLMYYVWLMFQK